MFVGVKLPSECIFGVSKALNLELTVNYRNTSEEAHLVHLAHLRTLGEVCARFLIHQKIKVLSLKTVSFFFSNGVLDHFCVLTLILLMIYTLFIAKKFHRLELLLLLNPKAPVLNLVINSCIR